MRHGSHLDPQNRFEKIRRELDLEHLEWDQEHLNSLNHRKIEYIADSSQSIVSENNSPDIPFRYSVNPYRGCIHACAYCYARPTHEYLGFNAGLDFETKIVVKHDASRLLRDFLARDSWHCESITFSGVTDCYQPAEREFKLTRQCLQVALDSFQPVSIVTKNALVVRDLDLLQQLAAHQLVHVYVSITSLDPKLAREMEPRTSVPAARLRAVEMLSQAGIPVGVLVAPMIPGLNDAEMPQIMQAAREAGATVARYILLRLPLNVEPVFLEWLQRTQPLKYDRVVQRIQQTRGGQMNESSFGQRMVGKGELADQIRAMYHVFHRKLGFEEKLVPHRTDLFKPPPNRTGQLRLF